MAVNITILVFTQILLFLVGLFYIRWHINLKRWDKPFFSALIINITWVVIGIVVGLTIYSWVSQNLFTDLLIIIINIFIGLGILIGIYKKNWLKSLEIVALAQISFFIITIYINSFIDILAIFVIEGDDKLDGSKFTFSLFLLFIFGISGFIASWGDKIQLVKLRRVVVIVGVIPGLLCLMLMFITQQRMFFDNFIQDSIISISASIITIVIES